MYTDFDKRMKENYENRSKVFLTRRTPVIIRADGKSFHTFCKRFEKPYDVLLNDSLADVMKFLCQNIQGAKFAERHSDEISILVTDYETLQTDAYFDYNVQKICSVVASMATAEFCRVLMKDFWEKSVKTYNTDMAGPIDDVKSDCTAGRDESCRLHPWENWPTFDARCFNIPKEEVANYVWWRMVDAKRNSVSMLAQSKFSHKELHGKSSDEMQEMLWQTHGINWSKLSQRQKIGDICVRGKKLAPIPKGSNKGKMVERNVWEVSGSPKTRTELGEIIEGLINNDREKTAIE